MESIDGQSAYLYGKLNEEIFMEQPEGSNIPGSENKFLHLKKALYVTILFPFPHIPSISSLVLLF